MGISFGREDGYTVMELVVVMVLIGIFTALIVFAPNSIRDSGYDQERADDAMSIARRLEMAYTDQDLERPAYPSTREFLDDISSHTRTATGLQADALKSPDTPSGSSVVAATSASTSTPISGGVKPAQYVYQPLTASNTLCTASDSTAAPCVRFYLYYYSTKQQTALKIKSLHQQ